MRTPLIALLALAATLVSAAPTHQGKHDVLAAIKRDIRLESKSELLRNDKRETPKMTIHTNYTKKRGQTSNVKLSQGGIGKRGKVVERVAKAPPKTNPPQQSQQQQQSQAQRQQDQQQSKGETSHQQEQPRPSQQQTHAESHSPSPSSSSPSEDSDLVPIDKLGLGLDSEALHRKRQEPDGYMESDMPMDNINGASDGQADHGDESVVEERRADGRILKKRGKIYWLEDPLDARQWGGARELSDEDDEPVWY